MPAILPAQLDDTVTASRTSTSLGHPPGVWIAWGPCLGLVLQAAAAGASPPLSPPQELAEFHPAATPPQAASRLASDRRREWVGNLSCGTVSCHGSPLARPEEARRTEGAARIWFGETTLILARHRRDPKAPSTQHGPGDPHAHAWRRLLEPRYQAMLRAASGRADGSFDPAIARRCASCHDPLGLAVGTGQAMQTADGEVLPPITRGIGCETCHGPAQRWLALHYQEGIEPSVLRAAGMIDTKDLLVRARLCSTCHVGSPEHDLDHDLLAAGHPPLRFELAAYQAMIREPHWDEASRRMLEPSYEVQLWAVGRLAAAEASLKLLAHRARRSIDKKVFYLQDAPFTTEVGRPDREPMSAPPWPSWAEHNCLACHLPLRPNKSTPQNWEITDNQKIIPVRGVIAQRWNRALVAALLAELRLADAAAASRYAEAEQRLIESLERDAIPDPAMVARNAEECLVALQNAIVSLADWRQTKVGTSPSPQMVLKVVERSLADRAGRPQAREARAFGVGDLAAEWEHACHCLLALAAVRRSLADARQLPSPAAGEEKHEAAAWRQLAAALRFKDPPEPWPEVLGSRGAEATPASALQPIEAWWDRIDTLHRQLRAIAASRGEAAFGQEPVP